MNNWTAAAVILVALCGMIATYWLGTLNKMKLYVLGIEMDGKTFIVNIVAHSVRTAGQALYYHYGPDVKIAWGQEHDLKPYQTLLQAFSRPEAGEAGKENKNG